MRIITVSRQFGSGGREVGKRLAEYLGVSYWDREIISEIANRNSMDEGYIEKVLESDIFKSFSLTFGHTFAYAPTLDSQVAEIFAQQQKIVKELASRGDCVIVGRSADAVLTKYNPFKIFVYADMAARIDRCRKRSDNGDSLTNREIEKKIKNIDKARAHYHDLVSDISWGSKDGCNLMINTTGIDIKSIIPPLGEYAKAYFEGRK